MFIIGFVNVSTKVLTIDSEDEVDAGDRENRKLEGLWRSFESKNSIPSNVYKLSHNTIQCLLCKTKFSNKEAKTTYKYARDHNNRSKHHQQMFAALKDSKVETATEFTITAKHLNERYEQIVSNFGYREFQRSGDSALCRCGTRLQLTPLTGDFMSNITQHRSSEKCRAACKSSAKQKSLHTFFNIS